MSGFGEQRPHGTYDDVAAELGAAARKLAAPLALVARNRAMAAQRETTGNRAQLAGRQQMAKAADTQLHARRLHARTDAARQAATER